MAHQRSRSWAGSSTIEQRSDEVDERAADDLNVEDVVSEFFYSSLRRRGYSTEALTTAGLSRRGALAVDSPERQLALRLQQIGDSVTLDDATTLPLIEHFDDVHDDGYETFREVARRMIRGPGPITWGRVAALFLFGVRLAETWMERRPRRGVLARAPALLHVVAWLSQFVVEELIAWITAADGGGWRGIVDNVTRNYWKAAIGGACIFASVVLFYLRR
ncbi:apoptosis regulator BAX-like [Oscarella lobularis]|uniref:apoptosis regulator BAX-like n=1 Tax=Oscarella lobularis TaxID=121494 RepID=UPI00331399C2